MAASNEYAHFAMLKNCTISRVKFSLPYLLTELIKREPLPIYPSFKLSVE